MAQTFENLWIKGMRGFVGAITFSNKRVNCKLQLTQEVGSTEMGKGKGQQIKTLLNLICHLNKRR